MRINSKMVRHLNDLQWENVPLSPSLEEIADGGFLRQDGAYLFTEFAASRANIRLEEFQDLTGYECAVNSLHIEDYVQRDVLAQSCAFIEKLMQNWTNEHSGENARIILSYDDGDAVVKMHKIRAGEEYLASNLEEFLDAVLEVDTSETLSVLRILQ